MSKKVVVKVAASPIGGVKKMTLNLTCDAIPAFAFEADVFVRPLEGDQYEAYALIEQQPLMVGDHAPTEAEAIAELLHTITYRRMEIHEAKNADTAGQD